MHTTRVRQFVAVFLIGLIAASVANAKGSSSSHSSHSSSSRGGNVSVRGYTKSNGTYFAPHHRSAPDGVFGNNWSTVGNVNPYTGKLGTLTHPPIGYGRSRSAGASSSFAAQRTATDRSQATTNDIVINAAVANNDAAADQSSLDIEPNDGTEPIAPKPKVVRKPVTWPAKLHWATDNMTAAERAEHAQLSEKLKRRGVNLVFWDKYSLDQLYDFERQLNTKGHIEY